MSAGAFTVSVHYAGGRTTRQAVHTAKAARHHAKRLSGTAGVERITLEGPDVSSELWAKADETPVATLVPAPFATIEHALPNRSWTAGRRR